MTTLPLRRRTLTVGASCALHAGLIGAILVAGHWVGPMLREKLPILPVEIVTEEPKPLVTPPPPPPKPVPPARLRPPKLIQPPPKIADAPPPPPPEPVRQVVEPPPPPTPPPPVAPPSQPAVAANPAPPVATQSAGAPGAVPAPASAPNQGGVDLRTPAPTGPAGTAAAPASAPGPVASAPSRSTAPSQPTGITRTARPQGGYQVRPSYPPSARQAGIQGTTILRVHVLIDGQVGEVRVQESAGHPDLDEAAAEAVRRWKFEPARRGPDPVAMWVLLPVEFRLK